MRQVRADRRCYRLTLQHLPSAACTPWSFPPGRLLSVGVAVVSQYSCATPWHVFISNNVDTQFCLGIQWQGERPSLLHYPSFQRVAVWGVQWTFSPLLQTKSVYSGFLYYLTTFIPKLFCCCFSPLFLDRKQDMECSKKVCEQNIPKWKQRTQRSLRIYHSIEHLIKVIQRILKGLLSFQHMRYMRQTDLSADAS